MSRPSGRGPAVAGGAPPGNIRWRLAGEEGAQALEFAMVLPAVAVVILLVVSAAFVGVDAMVAQGLAREGVRVAAVHGPQAAAAAVRTAAAGRSVEVEVVPPRGAGPAGDLVRVRIRLRARVPGGGIAARGIWLSAQAVMRVEHR